ncbi:GTP-binding protein REM 1 isoform X2 [Hyla sarda]|nr:GTP-binding protein REM 1 isoform X2 [Hyla sarda]XP_056403415.1 GTP-binding protein REM 1 isoform X2 [Hyla sarda]XP_056403416.1 GTP-binding protein REM 1 isoform X2 [Hyla sarda]
MCAARTPLRRRASTPLPCAHQNRSHAANPIMKVSDLSDHAAESEISGPLDLQGSEGTSDGLFRVVVLGDPGVGKSSLVGIFRREQDRESGEQQQELYQCTLTVDGEDTSLLLMDISEIQKRTNGCDGALRMGHAYIIVYSVTDRSSFESASELRIQLRRTRQYENIPIILVGNKTDLVRSREVSVEEGRACAVVFDCKFIETSAVLQHNVQELFEGMVRQIRLRRDGADTAESCRIRSQRKESLGKRARRFLDRLVTRNSKTVLRVHSRSCHDLSVL